MRAGDAAGALAAVDAMRRDGDVVLETFGDAQGAVVDRVFGDGFAAHVEEGAYRPRVCVEFARGSAGYSAARVARWLARDAVLHAVDDDALGQSVRMAVAAAAGVADRVRPALAAPADWLRAFERSGQSRSIDFLLIAHGDAYKALLELALKLDLLNRGCVVVADGGGADYARFVKNDARFRTTAHASDAGELLVAAYQGRRSDAYAA